MFVLDWIIESLRSHPEVVFFLTLGVGFLIGQVKIGAQKLGSVLGVLVAGLIIGQIGVSVGANVKWIFFDLFLFAVGFKCGPQFVQGLRSSGVVQVGLTLVFFAVAMTLVIGTVVILGLDAGSGVGMFAGSLTVSAALGVAGDALQRMSPSEAELQVMQTHMASAFAACYVIGMLFTTWFLSRIGPKVLGIDLAQSCKQLEHDMGVQELEVLCTTLYHEISIRSYRVDASHAGRTVAEIESDFTDGRVFVEAIHRGAELITPSPDDRVVEDDVIALTGREILLASPANPWRMLETSDRTVLEAPTRTVTVIVNSDAFIDRPLSDLARHPDLRSVFLVRLERGGLELTPALSTTLQAGDRITITGRLSAIEHVAEAVGTIETSSKATNMLAITFTIVLGALIGLPAIKFGQLELGLGVGVGILIGGLALGYLRSRRKHTEHISESVLWLFDNVGLSGFVAVTALEAAPQLIPSLQEVGFRLLVAGLLISFVPHLVVMLVGKYIFKVHPGILLGICAGAGVLAPGLAAVQDVARSKVPTIGYSVTYALGNILLALGGSILVTVLL